MPVIFNGVRQFVEAVGRQTIQEKPDALDTIEAIYTGPNAGALAFLPLPKTPFLPQFPLMTCARAAIVAKEGLVAEVRVSYVGKLKGNGNAVVITPPEINQSRHLGSVSYTSTVSVSPVLLVTTSYTVRYTALGVTFRYLTNRSSPGRFTGNFVSQSGPYLGTQNVLTFRTSIAYGTGAPSSGYMEASLVFEDDLVSVDVEDQGTGWYQVSEQYLTQALINTNVVGTPGASGTSGNRLPAFT